MKGSQKKRLARMRKQKAKKAIAKTARLLNSAMPTSFDLEAKSPRRLFSRKSFFIRAGSCRHSSSGAGG